MRYKLRFTLRYTNPRAEPNEPSIRSVRFGLGRDETERRCTLLGRTETETEHLVAPRDRTEMSNLYPETSPSSTKSRFARLVCRPDGIVTSCSIVPLFSRIVLFPRIALSSRAALSLSRSILMYRPLTQYCPLAHCSKFDLYKCNAQKLVCII